MNIMKANNNLNYWPNFKCGYDVDHKGYECPYHAPWDARRNKSHLVPGASMKGEHKRLADGTGAGIGWFMTEPISQAQWVVAQRE